MKSHKPIHAVIRGVALCALFLGTAYAPKTGLAQGGQLYDRWQARAAWQQRPTPGASGISDSVADARLAVTPAAFADPPVDATTVHPMPSRLMLATEGDPIASLESDVLPYPPTDPVPDAMISGEVFREESYMDPSCGCSAGCGDCYGDCYGDCCCECGGPCYGDCGYASCYSCYVPLWVRLRDAWQRHNCGAYFQNSSLLFGVEGFKSQVDMGSNGNFGFHEGINLSGPLDTCFGVGFQAGVLTTQTNLSGNSVDGLQTRQREQVFYTLGVYRRAVCGGMQWGVVYDGLHDNYYSSFDLGQIRAEVSHLWPGRGELGFYGAFHVGSDTFRYQNTTPTIEPYDYYTAFYRKYFDNGGQGRISAGVTNFGDALVGAEYYMPLNHHMALNSSFAYLIPKEGHGTGGWQNESWNVAFGLVLTRDCMAYSRSSNPYQPLFNIADNSSLIPNVR